MNNLVDSAIVDTVRGVINAIPDTVYCVVNVANHYAEGKLITLSDIIQIIVVVVALIAIIVSIRLTNKQIKNSKEQTKEEKEKERLNKFIDICIKSINSISLSFLYLKHNNEPYLQKSIDLNENIHLLITELLVFHNFRIKEELELFNLIHDFRKAVDMDVKIFNERKEKLLKSLTLYIHLKLRK